MAFTQKLLDATEVREFHNLLTYPPSYLRQYVLKEIDELESPDGYDHEWVYWIYLRALNKNVCDFSDMHRLDLSRRQLQLTLSNLNHEQLANFMVKEKFFLPDNDTLIPWRLQRQPFKMNTPTLKDLQYQPSKTKEETPKPQTEKPNDQVEIPKDEKEQPYDQMDIPEDEKEQPYDQVETLKDEEETLKDEEEMVTGVEATSIEHNIQSISSLASSVISESVSEDYVSLETRLQEELEKKTDQQDAAMYEVVDIIQGATVPSSSSSVMHSKTKENCLIM